MKQVFSVLIFVSLSLASFSKDKMKVEMTDRFGINVSLVSQRVLIKVTFMCAGKLLSVKLANGTDLFQSGSMTETKKVIEVQAYETFGNYTATCESNEKLTFEHLYRTCVPMQANKAYEKCKNANFNACLFVRDEAEQMDTICTKLTRDICDRVHKNVESDLDMKMCTDDKDKTVCHSLALRNEKQEDKPFYRMVRKEDCGKTALGYPIYSILIYSPADPSQANLTCDEVYKKDKKQLILVPMSKYVPIRKGFFRACVVMGTDPVQVSIHLKTSRSGSIAWRSYGDGKHTTLNEGKPMFADYAYRLKFDAIYSVKVHYTIYSLKNTTSKSERGKPIARSEVYIMIGGYEVKPNVTFNEKCTSAKRLRCSFNIDIEFRLPFLFTWRVNGESKAQSKGEMTSNIIPIESFGIYECNIKAILRQALFLNERPMQYNQIVKYVVKEDDSCLDPDMVKKLKEGSGGGSGVFLHLAIALGGIVIGGIFLLMCVFLAKKTKCGTIGPFSWFSDKSTTKKTKASSPTSVTFS